MEFNLHEAHALDDISLVKEDVLGAVEVTHEFLLGPMLDYRRQLKHVTDEDDLLATEGLSRAQHLAHRVVDGINDVASNHRDLIDDDGVGVSQRKDFGLVHLPAGAWHTNVQRQAEEGMDRFAPREDGGHAGWSKNDKVLVHYLLHIVQEGCLTSSSSSCEEEA